MSNGPLLINYRRIPKSPPRPELAPVDWFPLRILPDPHPHLTLSYLRDRPLVLRFTRRSP